MDMNMDFEFKKSLAACPVIAILRGAGPDEIIEVAERVANAGIRLIEVTMNSPNPLESVAILAERFTGTEVLVGAGTVLSVEEVAEIAAAGGRYIISPNVDVDVIQETKRVGLLSLPGFMTPTEAFTALNAGADYLKCFPAIQGPKQIKALKAVVPAPILAVGGVDLSNVADFLEAADGVGIGSGIYKPGKPLSSVAEDAAAFAELSAGSVRAC
jgi:2-dehydro-3-deoxyphosphogalactonate aldolase